MSPTDPPPFPALAALQDAHADMLADVGGNLLAPDHSARIRDFVLRAVGSGTRLDAKEDRSMAQGLVNFWAARVSAAVRTARDESAPRTFADFAFDDTLLAEFDPGTLRDAIAAGERWVAEQSPEDRNLARRIALRLTRFQPEGSQFDAVPTVRAAFHDLDTPERVDKVLDGLAGAGVVRVARAEEPRMDRVALRAAELLTTWPALAGWLGERSRFRDGAAAWEAGNKPAGQLLLGEALDEARNYHDRNGVEREFVIASAYRQQRESEQAASNRRQKIVWMILAAAAGLGWIGAAIGWNRAAEKMNRVNELNGELGEVNGVSEGRRIDAETRRGILERRQRLTDLRSLVSALANLSTARLDQHEAALSRWDELAKRFREHEYARFRDLDFKRLRRYAIDPANKTKIYGKDIEELRAIRTELVSGGGAEVEEAFRLAQAQSYDLVEVSARGIVAAFGKDKTYADAEPFARHFWAQYWGEMLLVEGPIVEAAMVEFGRALAEIQTPLERADAVSSAAVQKLTKEYLKGNRYADFAEKAKMLNAAGLAQLRAEFTEIPPQVYANLLKNTADKATPAGSAERLKPKLDALLKALAGERGGNSPRASKAQAL